MLRIRHYLRKGVVPISSRTVFVVTPLLSISPYSPQFPDYTSQARDLDIGAVINGISQVDLVTSTFSCDSQLHLSWRCTDEEVESFKKLVGEPDGGNHLVTCYQVDEMDGTTVLACNIPMPRFQNSLEMEIRTDILLVTHEKQNGQNEMRRVFRILAKFFHGFRCHYFPFDAQALPMKLVFDKHQDIHHIRRLHLNETMVNGNTYYMDKCVVPVVFDPGFVLTEYELHRPITSISYVINDDRPMAQFDITVMGTRSYSYFVNNIYKPSGFITTIALTMFFIPPCDVSERIGLVLTLVLTLTALTFMVSRLQVQ
jgi:hypothetical protein